MNQYTPKLPIGIRFWSKVSITSNNDLCWNWQAYCTKDGYGRFRYDGKKMILSHRLSWILINGQIPDRLQVLHSCDNPACCNPKHLFLGTHQDNMKDKIAKKRQSKLGGERNPSAKLSDYQISVIRDLYSNRKFTQTELARKFGVTYEHMNRILNYHVRNR
jgi:hypothetical protein